MNDVNPYKTPEADLSRMSDGQTDQSSPLSPQGRFGRLSYIAWGLLISLATGLVSALLVMMGAVDPTNPGNPAVMQILVSIPGAIIGVLFAIRRMHDINASGWWLLLMLVPLVNLVLGILLLVKAGTLGPNRFGPPRVTPVWERVAGIIGIVFFVLGLLGVVTAILIPMMLSA